jgi:orotidine-5'-phosphate decarboxylase
MMTRFLEKMHGPSPRIFLGLDPRREMMPEVLRDAPDALAHFCRAAVVAAAPHIDGVKINLAFFEAEGSAGLAQMEEVLAAIPPALATIGDAKRGDIGSSSKHYAKAIFDTWNFDAVTVNPLMGSDAVEPFLEYEDRTTFFLALTSNPGTRDIIEYGDVFQRVLELMGKWNAKGNAGAVIGATQPDEISYALAQHPTLPILAPGLGPQGAKVMPLREIFALHKNANVIFPLSRGILYPEEGDFPENIAEEAAIWRDAIRGMNM